MRRQGNLSQLKEQENIPEKANNETETKDQGGVTIQG